MNTPTVSHLAYTGDDIDKACDNILAHLWGGTGWYTSNPTCIDKNTKVKYLCILVQRFAEGRLESSMQDWIKKELAGGISFDPFVSAEANYRFRVNKVRKMRGALKKELEAKIAALGS